MTKNCFLLLLALTICASAQPMEMSVANQNFTELPYDTHYLILEFVCEDSKQPHVPAINIILGYKKYSLINKSCYETVANKLSLSGFKTSFEGKLYHVLVENKIRAVEPKGIQILKSIFSVKDERTIRKTLTDLPLENEPYILTAITLSVLMNDHKQTETLAKALFDRLPQLTARNKVPRPDRLETTYEQLLVPKPISEDNHEFSRPLAKIRYSTTQLESVSNKCIHTSVFLLLKYQNILTSFSESLAGTPQSVKKIALMFCAFVGNTHIFDLWSGDPLCFLPYMIGKVSMKKIGPAIMISSGRELPINLGEVPLKPISMRLHEKWVEIEVEKFSKYKPYIKAPTNEDDPTYEDYKRFIKLQKYFPKNNDDASCNIL